MNEKVVFLKDFLVKELYIIEDDCNFSDFIKENNLKNNLIVSESENLKKGDYVFIKNNKYKIHIVKPNESLMDIAFLHNTTVEEITRKNKNITEIFVGQQLLI